MKKGIALFHAVVLCLTMAACGAPSSATTSNVSSAVSTSSASTASMDELNALGDIEVEENLFDVEITMPADFVGDSTQEELNEKAKEAGVHSIQLNEDGTATYIMSKKQHAKILKETADSINESLAEMVGSEQTPNVTNITANEDFTKFTVTTKSTEPDMGESMSVLVLYMYSGLYGIFAGQTPENVQVDFVNADTGEVISSTDSSDMGN